MLSYDVERGGNLVLFLISSCVMWLTFFLGVGICQSKDVDNACHLPAAQVKITYKNLIKYMWTLPQIVKIQNGTKCNTIRKSQPGSIIIGNMPLLILRSPT